MVKVFPQEREKQKKCLKLSCTKVTNYTYFLGLLFYLNTGESLAYSWKQFDNISSQQAEIRRLALLPAD